MNVLLEIVLHFASNFAVQWAAISHLSASHFDPYASHLIILAVVVVTSSYFELIVRSIAQPISIFFHVWCFFFYTIFVCCSIEWNDNQLNADIILRSGSPAFGRNESNAIKLLLNIIANVWLLRTCGGEHMYLWHSICLYYMKRKKGKRNK